jgi:hypothetical protein
MKTLLLDAVDHLRRLDARGFPDREHSVDNVMRRLPSGANN